MSDGQQKPKLSWADVEQLVDQVVEKIIDSKWQPDCIIGLSRSGFVPATMIAYRLKIQILAGLDAKRNNDGIRSTGHIVGLKNLRGQKVLVVDDGIITGHLLNIVPSEVKSLEGEPRTCALISEGRCPDPDYLAQTKSVIPTFPWE
jgi:uncharacterized protein